TNRELYNSVLKRMKDVEVTGDVHASDISVVDRAGVPGGPSSPQRMRGVLLALVAGLMGGVGLALALERLENSLTEVEAVERYLGIPSLGVIPGFLGAGSGKGYPLRGSGPGRPARRMGDYSREIVLSYGSYSAAGEAYRMLRTAFVLSRAGGPPRTALITSAVKGDGKTITAVNLATMLAMTHKKVVLVDADLRLPRCHDLFALDNFFGLTEVLTGARELRDTIRPTEIEGLDILTSGEIPPNPSELLGSERMRAVLGELEGMYDYVIIDSTPVMQTSESALLASLVDGVIIVARSDSPKQQVRSALARLQYARAKILGLVLNKTGDSGGARYYYQYYASEPRGVDAPLADDGGARMGSKFGQPPFSSSSDGSSKQFSAQAGSIAKRIRNLSLIRGISRKRDNAESKTDSAVSVFPESRQAAPEAESIAEAFKEPEPPNREAATGSESDDVCEPEPAADTGAPSEYEAMLPNERSGVDVEPQPRTEFSPSASSEPELIDHSEV